MTKYQMLFRLLLVCKYLERLLSGAWLQEVKFQQHPHIPLNVLWGHCSQLRNKMLHFIQQFMYYIFVEVLEPNWTRMIILLREVMTFILIIFNTA